MMRRIVQVWTLIALLSPVDVVAQHEHHHEPLAEEEARPVHGHGHGDANAHMNRRSFEQLVAAFEAPGRDEWQKPDEVIALFGDLEGKTVIDIGSGTGYFSFPMAAAGAHVICADVDQRFLDYIDERIDREGADRERFELRKVPYDSSTLKPGEVDLALIVNTYHHIENREAYFAEVRNGLKPGGRLVLIDFFKRELPMGPPLWMKMAEDQVVAELVRAGFSGFEINRELLPHQYIIEAW